MNREQRYWEEYAAEKAAALKMAAKLTAREKGLVVTDTKRRLVNEAMHDQTRQRRFERKFSFRWSSPRTTVCPTTTPSATAR